MKGVYVLHDRETGEPYVGAAYGDTGIWDRLCHYSEPCRAATWDLPRSCPRKGTEYVRNNERISLLEFWWIRTDDQHVLDGEAYGKDVLISRSLGFNRN
jgi:hypothetical protein